MNCVGEWAIWRCLEDATISLLDAALDAHDPTYSEWTCANCPDDIITAILNAAALDGCVKRKAEGDSQPSKRSKNGELSITLLT